MYNHNKIEKKWQEYWIKNQTFKFKDELDKPKFYILDMFPYPSGAGLHVGHPKGYTASDVISRFKRLNGYSVLHPIGWDAFGLPAEQYAVKTNNHPKDFTLLNINNFRKQLISLGFDYDYDKEVNTTDPKYFRWTQWIFIQLYKQGLAEIKDIDVNWCEGLKAVLANEEVVTNKDGERVSEIGGFPVVRKPMRQWVLKITQYADKLIDGLDGLDWPESLKNIQKKWIGRTEGTNIKFDIENLSDKIDVFTTRIDTIYGVSYIVLSPKHSLVDKLTTDEHKNEVSKYIEEYNKLSDRDIKKDIKNKSGVFLGSYAINPITKQKLPIYISNYVVAGVGTKAVMGVPAHDKNDYEFAKLFNLPIVPVIKTEESLPYLEDGEHINSDILNGLNISEAINKMQKYVIDHNLGNKQVNYKLKDWIFSRQRYWGEPIPVLFDENNQIIIDENLPLLLPELSDFKPSDNGESPLLKAKDWLYVNIDGKLYKRDTNTMPQWAGSCWYYLGYLLKEPNGNYIDLDSQKAKEIFKRWLPVDIYIGGVEHAVLHLLYARFWHHVLYDIGVVDKPEPFFKMLNQGLILGEDGEKMSKSKGNTINCSETVESHGADTLRVYELFMGPLTVSMPWKTSALDGTRKWLDRVYRLYEMNSENDVEVINDESKLDKNLIVAYNTLVKNITNDMENFRFNIAISNMMVFINQVYKYKQFNNKIMSNFAIMLSCFAPHLGEELFHIINPNASSVAWQEWPQYDESKIQSDTVKIPVSINNKVRDVIEVPIDLDDEQLLEIALKSENVKKNIGTNPIKKTIVVKNKIINIII